MAALAQSAQRLSLLLAWLFASILQVQWSGQWAKVKVDILLASFCGRKALLIAGLTRLWVFDLKFVEVV
jgi:hypothetical protein